MNFKRVPKWQQRSHATKVHQCITVGIIQSMDTTCKRLRAHGGSKSGAAVEGSVKVQARRSK